MCNDPKHDDLNDDLSDLLGLGPRKAQADVKPPPAHYVAPTLNYVTERCPACAGTGRFTGFSGRDQGACRKCNGSGQLKFRSTRGERAKARDQRAERKVRKGNAALETFKSEHSEVYAWLISAQRPGFDFPASMLQAIHQYGSLTERQLAACERLAAKAKPAIPTDAPVIDTAGVDRLKAAFDHAIAKAAEKGRGLKWPRITIGDIVISPAKPNSKNPGALYVKSAGSYLGKVTGGKFVRSFDCSDAQETKVLAFVADPKKAAEAYGIETGVCCICNAELTNKVSVARGIGPICAERFGW
jgi:hypothetical protein